ncbi:MAG: hypothetical protein ABSC18_15470, partial [Verrucomicrobiota bacterium]
MEHIPPARLKEAMESIIHISLPSHRNLEKMVGNLMKTCHTAGHEKHKTSNRLQIQRCPPV